jgi:hypothetical protein
MLFAAPSYYAHALNALIMLLAVMLLVKHYRALRPYETIVVVLLFSIVMGVHGLSHLGLETAYGFNPLKHIIA